MEVGHCVDWLRSDLWCVGGVVEQGMCRSWSVFFRSYSVLAVISIAVSIVLVCVCPWMLVMLWWCLVSSGVGDGFRVLSVGLCFPVS